jgi:hypothetical protein
MPILRDDIPQSLLPTSIARAALLFLQLKGDSYSTAYSVDVRFEPCGDIELTAAFRSTM